MSPSKREREYARQRYSRWQLRRQTKAATRRRRRQILVIAVSVVAVVAILGGAFWFLRPEADTTAAPGPSADATPTADADNPCPAPTSAPPAEPLSFEAPPDPATAAGLTTATFETSCGEITVELAADAAPQAVASFRFLAEEGFYDSTPCHRLTTEGIFVLQCGDPAGTGQGGPGYSYGPVENAPADDVYPTGTLAMARVGDDAESMGSQFFIVYQDSTIPADAAGGYTVFGQVTAGLDLVQDIAEGGLGADGVAPARPISIEGLSVQ